MKRLIKRLAKLISLEITVERRDVHSQIMTENDVSPYLVLDRGALKRPLDEDCSGSSGTTNQLYSSAHAHLAQKSITRS